jgi:hypothetical protein
VAPDRHGDRKQHGQNGDGDEQGRHGVTSFDPWLLTS